VRVEEIRNFLKKNVGIVYIDSGRDCYARGIVKNISDKSLTLQTRSNLLILSLDSIKKLKAPLVVECLTRT